MQFYIPTAIAVLALSTTIVAETISRTDFGYHIPGVGDFTTHFAIDFRVKQTLDDFVVGDWTVGVSANNPYARTFSKDQVRFNPGESLSLIVSGSTDNYTSSDYAIPSAEICTKTKEILYGSVRTVVKVGKNPGACHGMFFYKHDNQETDIEILTSVPEKTYFANQACNSSVRASSYDVPSPNDNTDAYHEYRLDWLPDRTMYYIDGRLKATIKENVPSEAGPWVWNNWSNGHSKWSRLPGAEDVDMRIQSITAYWNITSVVAAKEAALGIVPTAITTRGLPPAASPYAPALSSYT